MSDLISIPSGAQEALDKGASWFFVVRLGLPTELLWTSLMRDTTYGGKTYLADNPLKSIDFSEPSQDAEGHVTISLFDQDRSWQDTFEGLSVRNFEVDILYLLPYGTSSLFPLHTFNGNAVEFRSTYRRNEGRITGVLVEDYLYQAKEVPGEYTSDDYQRGAAADDGRPYDNSHILANVSREVTLHRLQ